MEEKLPLEEPLSSAKQEKYERAISAFIYTHGRAPTQDEDDEIWNLVAFPELSGD